MASSTTSSLHLSFLTSQTLSISSSKPSITNWLTFPSSPFKQLPKLVSFSSCTPLLCTPSAARFIRYVAVSSEFDRLSEVEEDDSDEPPSYSTDLKLFVGNLPFSVDSAALAGLFEQAGNVEMVEVIYDKMTGRSRGFGFVTMSTMEEAEAAVQQFNGYELEGRALRVNSGPPPPRKEDSSFRGGRGGGGTRFDSAHRVYVGNLSWGVDNLALENLFSEQGKVMEARVVYDRDSGRSRGFGFVTYSSADEVNNAIERLDGADLDGRPLRVSVADARPRRQF